MGKSLVAFFSYGGRTAAVARRVAQAHWAPGSGGPPFSPMWWGVRQIVFRL